VAPANGVIRAFALLALSVAGVAAARRQSPWLEARFDHYSILYQTGSEADVPLLRGWADADERVMREKYGVEPLHYRMSIYLMPAPTAEIDVDRARNTCCTGRAPGDSVGKIEMLVPSSRQCARRHSGPASGCRRTTPATTPRS